ASVFSTDEYLRCWCRRAFAAKVAIFAVVVFILVLFVVGVYFAEGNCCVVAEAKDALACGDFTDAVRAAEAAGLFWVGDQTALRRQIEFRKALVPVEGVRAEWQWIEALEAFKAVCDKFHGEFAVDFASIEAEINVAMNLE